MSVEQWTLTLKRRLIDAVDESYHVKDREEIVEVLGALEALPVTMELLLTTQLGRTVNEFRRWTNDETLAERGKALVRKWRELVLAPAISLVQSTSGRPRNSNSDGGQGQSQGQLPSTVSPSNHTGPLRTGDSYSSNSSNPNLMPSSNSNVEDKDEIVRVLAALEALPVTVELLYTTLIGRTVNELRKRTSDETLAKRAKDLLKKWQEVVFGLDRSAE